MYKLEEGEKIIHSLPPPTESQLRNTCPPPPPRTNLPPHYHLHAWQAARVAIGANTGTG